MLLNTGLPVSEQDQGDYGEQIHGLDPTYSLSSLSGCCELLILRGLPYTLLYSSLPWSRVEVVTRSLLWLWTEVYTASLDCSDSFERALVCSPLSLFKSDFSTRKRLKIHGLQLLADSAPKCLFVLKIYS